MRKCRFVLGILAIILFVGCNDQNPIVSEGIFGGDKMMVLKDSMVGTAIRAYTVSDANAITSSVTNGIVGVHNDTEGVFGKTKASMAFQLRTNIGSYIGVEGATVDSAFLYLAYDKVYHDSTQLQNINVYQLGGSGLDYTSKYRANEYDSRITKGEQIVDQDFNYQILADTNIIVTRDTLDIKSQINTDQDSIKITIDTLVSSSLALRLENEYAQKVFINDANEDNFVDQEAFLEYFKGLCVDTDDITEEGALFAFNISNGVQVSSTQYNTTNITIHYHFPYTTDEGKDTIYTSGVRYSTNENSARVNFVSHDFTGSDVGTVIGEESESEILYLSGLAGTNVKLYIDDVNNWKDSADIAINKAELKIFAEKDSLYNAQNPVPEKLRLAVYDKDGEIEFYPGGTAIYGTFDKVSNSYSFNLNLYLQKIIQDKGATLNNGFLIYASNRREDPRRVILSNTETQTSDDKRIKLSITYTKIK